MAYTTRKDLLQKVHEQDDEAWRKFDEFYTPMILLRAKDLRLVPQEVEELMQNVRLAVFKNDACGRHDPKLGRFRDYLRKIITNCAYDILNARKSNEHFGSVPDVEDESGKQAFEEEWRQYILEKAMEEVRAHCDETTFMAFDLYGRQEKPCKEVAEILGISENLVQQHKSRVIKRLRTVVKRLTQDPDAT